MSDDNPILRTPARTTRPRTAARRTIRTVDEDAPRSPPRSARRLEFEFDREHTPHRVSTEPAVIETEVDGGEGPFLCDVVFSFDTTGSMRSVIDSVRTNLTSTVDRLFKEVDGIRIGLLAHGDYCDYPEMMWKLDLSNDIIKIKNFIIGAKNTSGGDPEENYEYVLNQACDFKWKAPVKVLVVIGDEAPHEKGYDMPTDILGFQSQLHIDWKVEVNRLKKLGVTVFSCHALPDSANQDTLSFYQYISKETGGYYFPLSELKAFKEYMVGICMKAADGAETIELLKKRQEDLQKEIEELKKRGGDVSEKVADLHEIRTASRDISEGRLFSSPMVHKNATKIRTEYKTKSRVSRYTEEMRSARPNLDVSSQAFISTIMDEDMDSNKIEEEDI
jgi:hypothetical protein